MRYAIFGDIHSNLESLISMYNTVACEVDKIICTGDVVGYAAKPNECVEFLREYDINFVLGNWDYWCADENTDCSTLRPNVQWTIAWTREQLTQDNKDYIRQRPIIIEEKDFQVVHATLHKPRMFNYFGIASPKKTKDILNDMIEHYKRMKFNISFIGHTHLPRVDVLDGNGLLFSEYLDDELKIEESSKYVINVGSVGQSRNEIPKAFGIIYDSENRTIKEVQCDYDIEKTQQEILETKLSPKNAIRLEKGK
ncbi:metallophosphatase family protein [Candidatus Woesearchaeota archaeon]|nr:metallophosphatase family protein [Candidatus Woesearchaeota archaeon]